MADTRAAAILAAIREREQAATPGPWTLETDSDDREYVDNPPFPYAIVMPEPHTELRPAQERSYWHFRYSEVCEMTTETAEFVVAARSDVPRLVAAVEAARVLALAWEAAGGPGEPVHLVHVERRACGSDLLAAITAALAGEDGAGE